MTITKQLFELQELDNDIENTRQTLEAKTRQSMPVTCLYAAGSVALNSPKRAVSTRLTVQPPKPAPVSRAPRAPAAISGRRSASSPPGSRRR